MRRVFVVALVLGFVGVIFPSTFLACTDAPTPHACTNIPTGGCPLARGLSCADPTCAAVYFCRPNDVWELKERCPNYDAAVPEPPPDAGPPDVAPPPILDASIDAPPGAFGGPGCITLQAPDCTLGLALACGAGCCGCEDLFVCQESAWNLWGACGDGGPVEGH